MRILAAHDAKGNIYQVVVSPTGAPLATVTTELGLLITEIEAPEMMSGLDLSDPERSNQQLSEVLLRFHDFRVDQGQTYKKEIGGTITTRRVKGHRIHRRKRWRPRRATAQAPALEEAQIISRRIPISVGQHQAEIVSRPIQRIVAVQVSLGERISASASPAHALCRGA
jgi:hypothetical protein